MREIVSSIRRIGLINSGMFDTLELNTDVHAMHLVGDNNVGKTSLIELIQFLYFPDVREMHFSKSLTETMAFYFRREGSYVLFEVRTLAGTVRTIGLYGTGTADARQSFVFDGPFMLDDFLDQEQHVLPLPGVAADLADRRFYVFTRVEDHERALVGEHSTDRANARLFDLSRPNFRLLRRLLQNLLRLERLSSREIRQFLNALVESSGAKTRIDIAHDFDRKYGEIRAIRDRIAALNRLKPLIDQWTAANSRAERARRQEHAARERLSYVALRYAGFLDDAHHTRQGQMTALRSKLGQSETQRQQLADQIAEKRSELRSTEGLLNEHATLVQHCQGRHVAEVRAERELWSHDAFELHQKLDQLSPAAADVIARRLERLRRERDQIQRQIEHQTLTHLLTATNLCDDERALAHFLLAEGVLSLPVSDAVGDTGAFLNAVRAAGAQVDVDGVFRGFGLVLPRAIWHQGNAQDEPLADRLAAHERQIAETERELTIARDRAAAQDRLQTAQRRVTALDRLLQAFQRLEEMTAAEGNVAAITERARAHRMAIEDLQRRQKALTETIQGLQSDQVTLLSELERLAQSRREISAVLAEIGQPSGTSPDDIAAVPVEQLPELFRLSRVEYSERRSAVRQANVALEESQHRLADLHEREAPDIPFSAWVAEKQLLTAEVEQLERRLLDSYANLIAVVKGELDKLTRAYDVVRDRVAELNTTIRRVSISNIERIELQVQESQLVEAIRQTSRIQLDLFGPASRSLPVEAAEQQIEEFVVRTLRAHGKELSLDDLFQLEFKVTFATTGEQRSVADIHAFESNGTAVGVKIVVYLGLIKLLQGSRRGTSARVPFFLDEVGSLSSNNVRQIIAYCADHNFLPIFASPTIRSDIPHSYILQRDGERSRLVNEVILTDGASVDEVTSVDHASAS
ncbi:MAG: hypothetical protein M3R24_41190 [Chloroflexota bacterium]|nr:hypothetical protein [Chloroflexota bacterium]